MRRVYVSAAIRKVPSRAISARTADHACEVHEGALEWKLTNPLCDDKGTTITHRRTPPSSIPPVKESGAEACLGIFSINHCVTSSRQCPTAADFSKSGSAGLIVACTYNSTSSTVTSRPSPSTGKSYVKSRVSSGSWPTCRTPRLASTTSFRWTRVSWTASCASPSQRRSAGERGGHGGGPPKRALQRANLRNTTRHTRPYAAAEAASHSAHLHAETTRCRATTRQQTRTGDILLRYAPRCWRMR